MNNDLIFERQQSIYNYILHKNFTTVNDICTALRISPSTVRRDLKSLEKQKKIKSFHGGVSVDNGYVSFEERITQCVEEKKRIGERAAALVGPNDAIYIGGGSTTYELAVALNKRTDLQDVMIVTAAMNIASSLLQNKAIQVIIPGGRLETFDDSMTSYVTLEFLKGFQFNKAFVGTQAFNAKDGYSNPTFDLNELKKVVMTHAKDVILLCDHTKIGKSDPYKTCDSKRINMLITDKYKGNQRDLKEIEKKGTEVVLV